MRKILQKEISLDIGYLWMFDPFGYINGLVLNSQKEIFITYVTNLNKAMLCMSTNCTTFFLCFCRFVISNVRCFKLLTKRSIFSMTCHRKYTSFCFFLVRPWMDPPWVTSYFSHHCMACSCESSLGDFPYYKDGGHIVVVTNLKEGGVCWQHEGGQLKGGVLVCQYEGGSYGIVATNLKERACVVIDANWKEDVDILSKEAPALLSPSQRKRHMSPLPPIWMSPKNL